MRCLSSLSTLVRVSIAALGGIVLVSVSSLGQVQNRATQAPTAGAVKAAPPPSDIPPCNGVPSGSSAGHAPSHVSPHPHSVMLSWNAAHPASNSPQDVIEGYYVYRSFISHRYAESDRISESLLRGTQCVDSTVEPKKAYFYVVKTVTEGGKESASSIEIKAVVPSP